ncbi:MAG TPA: ParA family protein [Anaerolineales bacterium]|nr:ParA family protein [Anaerolineae bacterium]HIQ01493.1 ParA family protein [Anaerolineales bacterium]
MTRVIAVANNKGGVAKTTTCLSLGGSLAEQGRLVLLVDLDPQGHLTASLGLDPESLRRTVGDVLLGQSSLVAVSRETPVGGLDLVPANQELVILDKVLYKRPGYESRLQQDLERMEDGLYDFVLMDCPPAFGTMTLNALTAADLLVIPIQCEYYSVRSLRQMLSLVSLVRRKTNPRLSYRLLVTMYDVRNRVHRLIMHYLRARFSNALFQTVIQVDTRLRESPAFGLPVTRYAPRTRAAHQYRALAQELSAHLLPAIPMATQAAGGEPLPTQESAASVSPPTRGTKE